MISARIEKVRSLIQTLHIASPSDYAWKEYLAAKERKHYKAAGFWLRCYYEWDE